MGLYISKLLILLSFFFISQSSIAQGIGVAAAYLEEMERECTLKGYSGYWWLEECEECNALGIDRAEDCPRSTSYSPKSSSSNSSGKTVIFYQPTDFFSLSHNLLPKPISSMAQALEGVFSAESQVDLKSSDQNGNLTYNLVTFHSSNKKVMAYGESQYRSQVQALAHPFSNPSTVGASSPPRMVRDQIKLATGFDCELFDNTATGLSSQVSKYYLSCLVGNTGQASFTILIMEKEVYFSPK